MPPWRGSRGGTAFNEAAITKSSSRNVVFTPRMHRSCASQALRRPSAFGVPKCRLERGETLENLFRLRLQSDAAIVRQAKYAAYDNCEEEKEFAGLGELEPEQQK